MHTDELLDELLASLEDGRLRALVAAYVRTQTVQSITEEALNLLSKAIDETTAA